MNISEIISDKQNAKIDNFQVGKSNGAVNNSIQYSSGPRLGRRSKRSKRSNNRRKQKRNNRGRQSGIARSGFIELPEINNKPIQTRCMRYTGTPNSNVVFTSEDIRCFVGFTNSGAMPYYPLVDSFQLQRVGVTILPNSVTAAGTVTFTWNGLNAPEWRETMLVSNATPFHKSFFPREGTSASFWWDNSSTTTNLFGIRSGNATDDVIILDIEFKYILNSGAITSVPLTTNSIVTGLVYRQLPIATLEFVPVDLDSDT